MNKDEVKMLKIALGTFHRQLDKIEDFPSYNGSDIASDFYNMICHLGEIIDVPDLCNCIWL